MYISTTLFCYATCFLRPLISCNSGFICCSRFIHSYSGSQGAEQNSASVVLVTLRFFKSFFCETQFLVEGAGDEVGEVHEALRVVSPR